MTEMTVVEPFQGSGAEVRTIREEFKLSRKDFADRCGFPTQTRLFNIETKDSWKDGDRERVGSVVAQLRANPPKETTGRKRGRSKGESGDERAARLMSQLAEHGKALTQLAEPDSDKDPVLFTPPLEYLDPLEASWSTPIQAGDEVQGEPEIIDAGDVADANQQDEDDGGESDADTSEFITDESGITSIRDLIQPGEKFLTNSEVSVWQRCRRKWWLAFYRKLIYGQIDYLGPREIGNRVHRALAAWYVPEGQERTDPRDALERAITDDWTNIERQMREHGTQGDVELVLADMATRYNDAVSLERAMIEGYMEWLTETGEDANLKTIGSERIVGATIEGDVAGEHVKVTTGGKIDVREIRVTDGAVLFKDHKTVGNFADIQKVLHMDPQMLHYHLIEWLNADGTEERVDGALYNMLRKVKRTARANPPFFKRVEVHHNDYEIDSYRRRLLGAARDIMRATAELEAGHDPMTIVYPNPTKGCAWDCDFFAICPMFDDGSRVEDALATLYHVGDPLARYAKDQEIGGIA